MIQYLIRVFSFFKKEIHDVRRQPRLLISLVGGPLLVLAAFGATFRSANPFITTALVWPENGIPGFTKEEASDFIGRNFALIGVTEDEDEAMMWLEEGRVDVVQIVPEINIETGGLSSRPELKIISNTIDPNAEAWIKSLGYGEKNYINQQLLLFEANLAQEKAIDVSVNLEDSQEAFRELSESVDPQDLERAEGIIQELRPFLEDLLDYLPSKTFSQVNFGPELSNLYLNLELLLDDLDELDQMLDNEEIIPMIVKIGEITNEIEDLRGSVDIFATTPPENIITPFRQTYSNLRESAFSLVIFYVPAVFTLLIQQLSISLGSLGLVRERQMGSFEMFRVSPLRLSQIILGKLLAYVTYVTFAGLILTLLLRLINVPLPVNIGEYLLLLVVLAIASVGIGFLISATSQTDSQAIQLSMLVLLLSIFFTSFFLPITGFAWPAWIIALLLPMTHAITGFQNLVLAGSAVGLGVWLGLGIIIFIAYGLVFLIMRRQYRKNPN
jgi:ABC-2 type transport system permease protein